MSNILMKLSSRKLWMAIAGVSTGIAMALGANTTDIQSITGGIMALISAVTYIVVEGRIDAESVKTTIIDLQEAKDVLVDE